ncbi:hypothetical protein PQR34_28925 [Paraburkholderia sediminicola]|uniref:hypothetical protein n=1 Tax=Paraburkholderia sediminicola TaxID=458836 RepID=UPI0038BB4DCA
MLHASSDLPAKGKEFNSPHCTNRLSCRFDVVSSGQVESRAARGGRSFFQGAPGWELRYGPLALKLLEVTKIKKIDLNQELYLQRVARRTQSRLARRARRMRRRGRRNAGRPRIDRAVTALTKDGRVWRVPKQVNLFLEPYRTEMLEGLRELRRCAKFGKRMVISFDKTERVFSDGMLLLVAELRRLLRYTEGRMNITCTVPLNDKVAQVAKQVGLLDMLRVECAVLPRDSDVVAWRHAYGTGAEGCRFDDVLADYDGEITPALSSALYRGVSEAMTNVVNHAYVSPRLDGLDMQMKSDWWMFSAEQDGKLSVVFCDLGAGISGTLPSSRPDVWRRITLRQNFQDGRIIKYAVADSVSRTKKGHRGKGLGQIVKVIEAVPGASVAVYSNRGIYRRTALGEVKVHELDGSILGTLINWQIPLPGREV